MNFHGQLRTDEPPDGDYVRYLEALVGQPPEDVEQAAIELAQRLGSGQPAAGPPAETVPGTAPRTAPGTAFGADNRVRATLRRPAPGLRQAFSRVLVVVGALLLGLGLIVPEAITMMPGIILLFAGLAIGRKAGRRPARTSSNTA